MKSAISIFLMISCVALVQCESLTDEVEESAEYSFSASVSPSEAGSVSPESGTYEEGAEVEVSASANDGWNFTEWTGDIQSSENTLTFDISSNTDLTANFDQLAQSFNAIVTVTDGTNSIELTLGMENNATSGYDSELDQEVPPPPSGSFYGQFNIPEYSLKADYRAVSSQEVVWEMELAPEEGNSLTLEWDFSSINHEGTLTLVDDLEDPSFELDMKSNTSHSVSSSTDILYIISN